MDQNREISVVIPVFNEEKVILSCLDSLSKQTLLPKEVIIVNNCSTDNTKDKAINFRNKCSSLNIRIVEEAKKGIKYARQKGFEESRGEVIAMTDADALFPKDWLAVGSRIFDSKYDVIAGWCDFEFNNKFFRKFSGIINRFFLKYSKYLTGYQKFLGATVFFKKDTLVKIGGYLKNTENIPEDIYIAKQIHKKRLSIKFDKDLFIYHSIRRTEEGGIKGLVKWILGWVNHSYYEEKDS
ncbi:glycosyltransferase [Candidatus Dojkabacteria bacterium]|nr:glycosyltransferase [Candidatus Dojkabacteria bacterium]